VVILIITLVLAILLPITAINITTMKEYQKWGITLGIITAIIGIIYSLWRFVELVSNEWFDGDLWIGAFVTFLGLWVVFIVIMLILGIHDAIWDTNYSDTYYWRRKK
jgi:uncharacterized membrane protein YagU involved in acid resistance